MRQRPSLVRPAAAAVLLAAAVALAAAFRSDASGAAKCAADNGGLTLAEGFCASIFTNDIGPVRHIAAAPNGDLYAATSGGMLRGGVTGLRDRDGDGKADERASFGPRGVNDVAVHQGYLYLALDDQVRRYQADRRASGARRRRRDHRGRPARRRSQGEDAGVSGRRA